MTVRQEDGTLFLEGRCGAEDAEMLLVALHDRPDSTIDASGLTRLHLAVAQVLLALRPRVGASPADPALARTIFAPLIGVTASALSSARDSA